MTSAPSAPPAEAVACTRLAHSFGDTRADTTSPRSAWRYAASSATSRSSCQPTAG